MDLPLAIVKARVLNWENMRETRKDIRFDHLGLIGNRIHYYKKLLRTLELEEFYNVRLPHA